MAKARLSAHSRTRLPIPSVGSLRETLVPQTPAEGAPSALEQLESLGHSAVIPQGIPFFPPSSSPSSPNDTALESPVPEDFRSCKHLLRCMASALSIQAGFVQEIPINWWKLAPGEVALYINEAILENAISLWNTPASLTPTVKCTDKRHYVPLKDFKSLFCHQAPNFLETAANETETGKI